MALEGKTWGPAIGPVPELVPETSVAAIVPAVGQLAAARVVGRVRCRRTAELAQTTSVIGLSHRDPSSVRVTMLLVEVDLTEALLDLQVTAEVPAWEAVDSAVALAGEADVLPEAHVPAADVVDD